MDINTLGIASVAAITVICYLIGLGVKATSIADKYIRHCFLEGRRNIRLHNRNVLHFTAV